MEKIGIKTALVIGMSALLLSSVQAAVPERLIPGGDTTIIIYYLLCIIYYLKRNLRYFIR